MRENGVRHDVCRRRPSRWAARTISSTAARVEAVQAFLGTEAGKNLLTAYGRAAQYRPSE